MAVMTPQIRIAGELRTQKLTCYPLRLTETWLVYYKENPCDILMKGQSRVFCFICVHMRKAAFNDLLDMYGLVWQSVYFQWSLIYLCDNYLTNVLVKRALCLCFIFHYACDSTTIFHSQTKQV